MQASEVKGPLAIVLMLVAGSARADKITPSGPLRAYKGPEGQLVVMVEISDGKEILVQFNRTAPAIDGKTLRERLEDRGEGNKTIFVDVKHGSKTQRSGLCAAQKYVWTCAVPGKPRDPFVLTYSEEASDKAKVDEVIKAYTP